MKNVVTMILLCVSTILYSQQPKDISIKFSPNSSSNKIRVLNISDELCVTCFRTDNGSENSNNHQLNCPELAFNWLELNRVSIVYLGNIYSFTNKGQGNSLDYTVNGFNSINNPIYEDCNNCIGDICDIFTPFNLRTLTNCDSVFLKWSYIATPLPNFEIIRVYNGDSTSFLLNDTSYVEKLGLNGIYVYSIRNGSSVTSENLNISECTNLPIELSYFKGIKESNNVKLEWETLSEKNNSHFEIQKSTNGIDFETMDIINGAGNSNKPISYSCIDYNPNIGINYYRLKQVDCDGRFELFRIISVDFDINSELKLYPNSSYGEFIVNTYGPIRIMNTMGQDIPFERDGYNVKIQNVPGIYFLITNKKSIKFIIK